MKHLIVLPGNSARNKAWGEGMLSYYAEYFDSFYLQEYDHWQTGANMDIVVEENKLRSHVENIPRDTQLFILAKSAGTILCLRAVQAGFLSPAHCVFFGMPLQWAVTDVFGGNWEVLEGYNIPTIAFHNEYDPTANYEYTKKIIEDRMKSVSLVTTEGHDHNYEDYSIYDQNLSAIFKK